MGACLGRPVDAVGLLAGLGGDVLHAARARLHVAHRIQRQVGPRTLPMQHRKAAAPRLPLEVHDLVVPVGQLQHLHPPTADSACTADSASAENPEPARPNRAAWEPS